MCTKKSVFYNEGVGIDLCLPASQIETNEEGESFVKTLDMIDTRLQNSNLDE